MKKVIKNLIRNSAIRLNLPITKNIKYDILTLKLMKKVLKRNSNCIDIGGFKGEIMDEILKHSPEGKHFIFEPIPEFFKFIKEKFAVKPNITVINKALSDAEGTANFNVVSNYPAYSGLKIRDYPSKDANTCQIEVLTDKLDNIIPQNIKIDFIKIDVEGAEYLVLKGGKMILKQSKPIVIFEYGLGASEYYGTEPEMIFNFLTRELNYSIFLIEDYLNNKPSLKKEDFAKQYHKKINYYFVAV